jgi:hypothetical protein
MKTEKVWHVLIYFVQVMFYLINKMFRNEVIFFIRCHHATLKS